MAVMYLFMQIEYIKSDSPVDYPDAVTYMRKRVDGILAGRAKSCIWFLEHPPLYTAGRSALPEELLDNKLPVYASERGGKYTYHGPGQRVVYLMLDLQGLYKGVPDIKKFVRTLEQWLINTLKVLSIEGYTDAGRVGVWTKNNQYEEKVAAIGVRVRRWVSSHGIALNVCPDLANFAGIIPCGIVEHGVTSVQRLNPQIDMATCDAVLLKEFTNLFDCKLIYAQI